MPYLRFFLVRNEEAGGFDLPLVRENHQQCLCGFPKAGKNGVCSNCFGVYSEFTARGRTVAGADPFPFDCGAFYGDRACPEMRERTIKVGWDRLGALLLYEFTPSCSSALHVRCCNARRSSRGSSASRNALHSLSSVSASRRSGAAGEHAL